MTQLIVSVEDVSSVRDVRKAIGLLRGVSKVSLFSGTQKKSPRDVSLKAMQDALVGDTIKCGTMDDYLKTVGYELRH